MSDDLEDRGPADRSRVSLSEPWEVTYWTRVFDVTEDEPRELVTAHGNSAQAIRDALGKG